MRIVMAGLLNFLSRPWDFFFAIFFFLRSLTAKLRLSRGIACQPMRNIKINTSVFATVKKNRHLRLVFFFFSFFSSGAEQLVKRQVTNHENGNICRL